ncbi:MAG: RodZ domain-containing protein [Sulfurifustaceae bacterium]
MATFPTTDAMTLGERLRQARGERGLSIEDVAASLRLAPRIVAALEDDAYDRLPGPTYVRGYLRGYALMLGLSPQQLIDAFNKLPQASRPVEMVAPAPAEKQVTSNDAVIRFGTLLVAVVVLGLAILWWSGKDGTSRRRLAAPAAKGPVVEAPAAPSNEASVPAESQAKVVESAKPTEPMTASASVKVNETAKPNSAVNASGEKRVPAVATSEPEAAVAATDPNAPRVRLVLKVSDDSWADVRDAQQRRLIYETLSAGRVVSVEGVAPLSVFLGNADGVKVEYNGRPYDVQRYRRGDVARFTLGATGSP